MTESESLSNIMEKSHPYNPRLIMPSLLCDNEKNVYIAQVIDITLVSTETLVSDKPLFLFIPLDLSEMTVSTALK